MFIRFNRLLLVLAGVIMLAIVMLVTVQHESAAAAVPLSMLPSNGLVPTPGGCQRAATAASSLQQEQLAREDMIAVLRDLSASTNKRVQDDHQRMRQQVTLKHSQELVDMELAAIAELQTTVKMFQRQHCQQAK